MQRITNAEENVKKIETHTLQVRCKMVTSSLENSAQFLIKLTIEFPSTLPISLLCRYPRKMKIYSHKEVLLEFFYQCCSYSLKSGNKSNAYQQMNE